MYPTSIDGKPSAGGFRMPHQTVRDFRTGFSRSDREFEEALTPCRKTSVIRQGEASHQPSAIEHSHVAVLAEGLGVIGRFVRTITVRRKNDDRALRLRFCKPLFFSMDARLGARSGDKTISMSSGDAKNGHQVQRRDVWSSPMCFWPQRSRHGCASGEEPSLELRAGAEDMGYKLTGGRRGGETLPQQALIGSSRVKTAPYRNRTNKPSDNPVLPDDSPKERAATAGAGSPTRRYALACDRRCTPRSKERLPPTACACLARPCARPLRTARRRPSPGRSARQQRAK